VSYAAEEISVQDGAPVELYTFAYGVNSYRYTSREASFTDTTVSPNLVYASASIERSAIESSDEKARNTLKLSVPRNFAVAELFRVAPPSDAISVTVRRVHRGDTTSFATIWKGRVLGCAFQGARAELQCEPVTVSLARTGLRRLYGKSCPYALYGQGCGLNKADFDTATTVSAIDGLTLTVASIGAFSYAGGFVEWVDDDGNTQRRFIESHVLTALKLTQAFSGLSVSDAVTIYPGCDHTLATCATVFSNNFNFGGFPFMPVKNPFRGDPVY